MMFSGQLFSHKNNNSFRIHMNEPFAVNEMAKKIFSLLPKNSKQEVVVVCIGTDRSTGDSLGPLVGKKLMDRRCNYYSIFGTLNEPVHAKNLENTIETVYRTFSNPFIVAVDACLGKASSVGYLTVSEGPLKPGSALNKKLPSVGDIHITGIVNIYGFMELVVLQNTRLSIVMNMADIISRALIRSGRWLETENQLSMKQQKNSSIILPTIDNANR